MPRDLGMASRKRHHPDGLHLSSSLHKRLLSTSEAEIGSSVEDASISPGSAMHSPDGSFCNSASSALFNPDCSTSIHPTHSSMSLDAPSSKLEAPGFVLSRIPSDAASCKLEGADRVRLLTPSNVASYDLGTLSSTRDALQQGNGKGIWSFRSNSPRHKGLDCEGEFSEVTFEKHARTLPSAQEPGGPAGSEKATHIISRRDVSILNSKDELWHKAGHGYGDCVSRGQQRESSSKLFGARQKRDYRFSLVACDESASSCATADSMRPKQPFPQIYRSVWKESSTTPSHTHTRAEISGEPRLQETIGCKDDTISQRCASSEAVLHSPFTQKAAREELSPSYVLSSGRMSLEEETKLGRRAPTIDHDFEEYFSSLML